MLARHYFRMACQNAWANHRLHAACSQLSPEAFAATRVSFFPSIVATLNHVLTVDWYYVDALERWCDGRAPPGADAARFFDPEVPYADAAALRAAQRACDDRLVALCDALDDARLLEEVPVMRKALERERADRLLAHLFEHQIHHRGQAHAMMAGTAVKPPQLDEFFCANEAHLRARELAEIGLSEERIWS